MGKFCRAIKSFLLLVLNLTWCAFQNAIGFIVFLPLVPFCRVSGYRGMLCVYHNLPLTFTLGAFAFISNTSDGATFAKAHCYGHGVQSLLFGPFYLFAITVPLLVCRFPRRRRRRLERMREYNSIWQEKNAYRLAEFFGESVSDGTK